MKSCIVKTVEKHSGVPSSDYISKIQCNNEDLCISATYLVLEMSRDYKSPFKVPLSVMHCIFLLDGCVIHFTFLNVCQNV